MSLALFLIGLRFARMTVNPWAGKSILGQPVEGDDWPIERVNLLGNVFMVAAPIFFLVFAGLVLFGDTAFYA